MYVSARSLQAHPRREPPRRRRAFLGAALLVLTIATAAPASAASPRGIASFTAGSSIASLQHPRLKSVAQSGPSSGGQKSQSKEPTSLAHRCRIRHVQRQLYDQIGQPGSKRQPLRSGTVDVTVTTARRHQRRQLIRSVHLRAAGALGERAHTHSRPGERWDQGPYRRNQPQRKHSGLLRIEQREQPSRALVDRIVASTPWAREQWT